MHVAIQLALVMCSKSAARKSDKKDRVIGSGRKLLQPENLKHLAQILKQNGSSDGEGQIGLYHRTPHRAWDLIFDIYFPSAENHFTVMSSVYRPSDKMFKKAASFIEAYSVLVDATLLQPQATSNRKLWGLQLFERAIQLVAVDQLSQLVTNNLVYVLTKARELRTHTKETIALIMRTAEKSSTAVCTILSMLSFLMGSSKFDQATATKTCETLMSKLSERDFQSYIDKLSYDFDAITGAKAGEGDSDEQGLAASGEEARRKRVIDEMYGYFKNSAIPKSHDGYSSILRFFIKQAYFDRKAEGSIELSDSCRSLCIQRLYGILGSINGLVKRQNQNEDGEAATEESDHWVRLCLDIYDELASDTSLDCILAFEDVELSARKAAQALLGKIVKYNHSSKTRKTRATSTRDRVMIDRAFQTLISNALLFQLDVELGRNYRDSRRTLTLLQYSKWKEKG